VSLAFGQGIHFCMALGRPDARTPRHRAALTRCPHLALAGDDIGHDPRRMDRFERIPVTFGD
jgi:hypothetical protein